MTYGSDNLAYADVRREDRDDVHYHVRAFGPDAKPLTLLVVNVSPHGVMARCDKDYAAGQRIRLMLPSAGAMAAEVRWALGCRIGCKFDIAIDLATYYEMLATVVKR